MPDKRLQGRHIPQVQRDDLEAVPPALRVRLGAEAPERILRKAGRDEHARAVSQHPQRELIPDLDPPAGDQRKTAAQIGGLQAALIVPGGAIAAQLMVETVEARVRRLADVAL